jgi:hypothetical protein
MKGNFEPVAKLSKRPGHRATGDLSESAIKWRLRSEAVQHPVTLLSLTVFIMAGIYTLLLSPVFGGGLWVIALLVVSGLVTVAAFMWRYVFRYTEEYAKQVQELMENIDREQESSEREEVMQLRDTLQARFSAIGSTEGLKTLGELGVEYEQLQTALIRQDDIGSLSMSHIPSLAGDAYHRGLSVLADALELMEAGSIPWRESLESEIAELENEVEASKQDEKQAELLKIKEGHLAFRRQRLNMLDQLQLRVEQLLFQAERCGVSLHRTRIEAVGIRIGSSETRVDSVIKALQETINHVKEVQEELKRIGY